MKPPARITDQAAGGLGARLVRSARADAPPATSRQRAIVAAALAGATVSSMSGGAAASGAVAGGALARWLTLGVGGFVLAVAIGAAVVAGTDKSREPATPVATAVAAPPRSMAPPSSAPPSSAPPTNVPAALPPEIVAVPVESLPSVPVRMLAPVAAPRETAPVADAPAARSTLTQEIAILDDAKRALDASQADAALGILDRHSREFPRGALVPEATALRIEALYRRGDRAAAATLFRRFEETNPTSPVLDHVRPFATSTPKPD